MTGGGKSFYYWQKLVKIFCKFQIKTIRLIKINKLSKFFISLNQKGAILIEFAFCLPVLMVLIYYIYDLARLKRYYSQTEFVAMQIAQQLQNILSTRESKTITASDIRNINALAWLSVFPGTSMYYQGSGFPLGYTWYTHIYYVKGLADGKASCMTRCYVTGTYSSSRNPSSVSVSILTNTNPGSLISNKQNVHPSAIYPSLTINEGEVKVIVEATLCSINSSNVFKTSNGTSLTAKKAFGFYLLNPSSKNGTVSHFFNSVVIFTPKPELASALASYFGIS